MPQSNRVCLFRDRRLSVVALDPPIKALGHLHECPSGAPETRFKGKDAA